MATITITFNQQVQQTKDVDLPAFLSYNNSFYKITSAEDFIQVIPENAAGEITIKKWKNAGTVTRLLSDTNYTVCTSDDFNQAYQNSLTAVANYVAQTNI